VATFDHSIAAPGRLRVGVPVDRITRPATNVLCAALAAVYLYSAVTMPAGHAVVALGEAGVAALELGWIVLAAIRSRRGWVYVAGIALQLALTALWVVTRTVALPGIGRLPVGGFDLLCAADALVVAALCWRCAPFAAPLTPRVRLGLCQLAIVLAASTAYMSMESMMDMTTSPSAAAGAAVVHGQPAPHFFCHLL
jgi:hypothetical protein